MYSTTSGQNSYRCPVTIADLTDNYYSKNVAINYILSAYIAS